MPRHVPDDFSFLPTVDSTDEDLVDKVAQQKAAWHPPAETADPWQTQEDPAAHDAPPAPVTPAPHPRAAEMEQAVNALLNREITYDEPAAQDLSPEQQDGQTLWEDFMSQDEAGPGDHAQDEPTVPSPTVALISTPPPPPLAKERPKGVPPPPPRKKQASQEVVEEEKPLPTPRAPEVLNLRVDRGKGRRALVETPPVSFGLGGSLRDKAGRRGESPPEKPKADDDKASGAEDSSTPALSEPEVKPFIAPKVVSEEELDPEQIKKLRWRKLIEKAGFQSLGWSVVAHLVILSLATMIGYNQITDKQVDFLPGGGSAQSQAAAEQLSQQVKQKKNPWIKSKPQMRKVTVQSLSADIVLPEMPMDALDLSSVTDRMQFKPGAMGMGAPLGAGTAGSGGGLGSGIGRGGKFSFVGQTALGRRVVFVVDVSGSMSAVGSGETISRFDLLKKELSKSVSLIPMNTQYQILFFSDFAWPHDQVDSNNADALTKYKWEIDPKDYRSVKLPPYRFIQATPFSIRETVDIIQKSNNPGGTNWGSGLLMALSASPKPDVIFFMTDGLSSDEQGWVDIVTAENSRRPPQTVIHTSAMQQPDAARDLDARARRNNGTFSVVLGDGKIVKGEDFFKMKK